MIFWVYILACADGRYYTGHTNDLEKRLAEHTAGLADAFTRDRRPVRLVFCEEFQTRDQALERECQIKGWNRAKKEALIARDWAGLQKLSRGRR